jgi:hypothetical protein
MQVAVLDFEGKGITAMEADVLTNRFRGELVDIDCFIVLERKRMQQIFNEVGFQMTGCTETSCAVEAGKILNVGKMIAGSIGRIGETYTVDVALIDVETSRIEGSIRRDHNGKIDSLLEIQNDIAFELAGKYCPDHKGERKSSTTYAKIVSYHIGGSYLMGEKGDNSWNGPGIRFCYHRSRFSFSGLWVKSNISYEDDSFPLNLQLNEDIHIIEIAFDFILTQNRQIATFLGCAVAYTYPQIKRYEDEYVSGYEKIRTNKWGLHPQAGVYLYRQNPVAFRLSIGGFFNQKRYDPRIVGITFDGSLLLHF